MNGLRRGNPSLQRVPGSPSNAFLKGPFGGRDLVPHVGPAGLDLGQPRRLSLQTDDLPDLERVVVDA